MFNASVTISPLKPSFFISKPSTISGERVAGMFGVLSTAGNEICATITDFTPFSIALLKGTSSTLSILFISLFITGKSLCVSISVSPCPGKCFAVAITPPS